MTKILCLIITALFLGVVRGQAINEKVCVNFKTNLMDMGLYGPDRTRILPIELTFFDANNNPIKIKSCEIYFKTWTASMLKKRCFRYHLTEDRYSNNEKTILLGGGLLYRFQHYYQFHNFYFIRVIPKDIYVEVDGIIYKAKLCKKSELSAKIKTRIAVRDWNSWLYGFWRCDRKHKTVYQKKLKNKVNKMN